MGFNTISNNKSCKVTHCVTLTIISNNGSCSNQVGRQAIEMQMLKSYGTNACKQTNKNILRRWILSIATCRCESQTQKQKWRCLDCTGKLWENCAHRRRTDTDILQDVFLCSSSTPTILAGHSPESRLLCVLLTVTCWCLRLLAGHIELQRWRRCYLYCMRQSTRWKLFLKFTLTGNQMKDSSGKMRSWVSLDQRHWLSTRSELQRNLAQKQTQVSETWMLCHSGLESAVVKGMFLGRKDKDRPSDWWMQDIK